MCRIEINHDDKDKIYHIAENHDKEEGDLYKFKYLLEDAIGPKLENRCENKHEPYSQPGYSILLFDK